MTELRILRDYMLGFVGMPYRWGGDDPINGYDCSGFAQEILAAFGKDPKGDQTAAGLYQHFIVNGDIKKDVRLGYLVFYGRNAVNHVAVGIGDGMIIEAAGGGRNTLSPKDAARDNAYVRVRPWNHRNDLICVIDPVS